MPRFINDVYVTRRAAFFTNSSQRELYRVPLGRRGEPGSTVQTIPVPTGLNGIEATANGKILIAVQPSTGKLFRIDPDSGSVNEIVLNTPVMFGDGLVVDGRTLYVVENRNNRVAVDRLSSRLTSGEVEGYVTGDVDIPSTADQFRGFLYLVNARFGTPSPDTAAYWITQIEKRPNGDDSSSDSSDD